MSAALSTVDLAIDHELAAIAGSISFLLGVTPINLLEVRRAFLDHGELPPFEYRPLENLDVVREQLGRLDIDEITHPELLHLVRAKQREIELQLDMLECRGSERFRELAVQLYGPVSPRLLGDAEAILELTEPAPAEPGDRLGAEEFARLADLELDHYRAFLPDLDAHVEIRPDSTGVMVDNGNLLIAPTTKVARGRVTALLQHEIGTHVLTHVNGSRQPLRLLGAGLAGYDETQEGLAVFAEHLVGELSIRRIRQLAARVVAVHQMLDGDSFAYVHGHLVESGIASTEAFTITMRVFRSGGLTKDAVYLRGLAAVVAHIGAGESVDTLWLGKMSLDDLPHIESLRERGAVNEPLLVPRYLRFPGVAARLTAIDSSTTLHQLIGASA